MRLFNFKQKKKANSMSSGYQSGVAYFKRHKVTFADILKVGEKTNVDWHLIDGVNAEDIIEDVRPNGCNCTASFTWGGDKVSAVFTNQESGLAQSGQVITKSIKVYFKDGLPKIPSGRGGMMWHPQKAFVKLEFSGHVVP